MKKILPNIKKINLLKLSKKICEELPKQTNTIELEFDYKNIKDEEKRKKLDLNLNFLKYSPQIKKIIVECFTENVDCFQHFSNFSFLQEIEIHNLCGYTNTPFGLQNVPFCPYIEKISLCNFFFILLFFTFFFLIIFHIFFEFFFFILKKGNPSPTLNVEMLGMMSISFPNLKKLELEGFTIFDLQTLKQVSKLEEISLVDCLIEKPKKNFIQYSIINNLKSIHFESVDGLSFIDYLPPSLSSLTLIEYSVDFDSIEDKREESISSSVSNWLINLSQLRSFMV